MTLYKTIKKEAEASQTIEKSKFISHIKPVNSREEADEFINAIKKKYKDATHNVPAIVIGDKFQIQWASDDGEPQGTSGAPIVHMLVSEGITNVAVVITRYFGGIKLGTGGLVRAYTGSARLGIEAAGICDVDEVSCINVAFAYSFLSSIQKQDGVLYRINDVSYSDRVEALLKCPRKSEQNVIDFLNNLTSGDIKIKNIEIKIEGIDKKLLT